MGFFDSSSSSSTTNNFDKRLAVDSGAGISGDSNSMTFSTTNVTTDSGSVASAISFGRDVAVGAASVVNESVKASAEATRLALEATGRAMSDALSAITKNSSDSYGFASTVADNASRLADRSLGYMSSSAAESLGMASHVVDRAFDLTSDFRKSTENLSGDAIQQVARAYDTATNYQAEKSTQDNRYLMTAALAVIGVVAIKAFAR